jgi:hypothetical protein
MVRDPISRKLDGRDGHAHVSPRKEMYIDSAPSSPVPTVMEKIGVEELEGFSAHEAWADLRDRPIPSTSTENLDNNGEGDADPLPW